VLPCKAASSELAPDPALDPLWISYWEPFHGIAKKGFGFQVTIKAAEDTSAAPSAPAPPKGVAPPNPEDKDPEDKKPETKKPVGLLRRY
jgi:hypothetical protein